MNLTDLLFQRYIKSHLPQLHETKFLVALSGGADSVALFHLCRKAQLQFEAAHVNYGLRGKESDNDQLFVQELCDANSITLHVLEAEPLLREQNPNNGIQEKARQIRYNWFEEILMNRKLSLVATAHHANDNAETVLFNITRGSGFRGLSGIPQQENKRLRPLLPYAKSEILHYLQTNSFSYREDSSNSKKIYKRNKIRLDIIPQLEQVNNMAVKHINQIAALAAQMQCLIEDITKNYQEELQCQTESATLIDYKKLPSAYRQLLLYELLKPFALEQFAEDIIQERETESGKMFVGETYAVVLNNKNLVIEPLSDKIYPEQKLHPDSVFTVENQTYTFQLLDALSVISTDSKTACMDADKISFPLTLRSVQNGDRFKPLGMKKYKKVSDFLTDLKLDIFSKKRVQVIESNGEIIWLVGMRLSESVKVTDTSKRFLVIQPKH